ncbi:MAG TPA: hypothetical protein VHQ65_05965 [Thermoanaerobaculia bacterium]|nr:hypothetical protein [Thermoanaerobaculia bacterium]
MQSKIRKTYPALFCLVLGLAVGAGPSAAAQKELPPQAVEGRQLPAPAEGTRLLDVQAEVTDLATGRTTRYDIQPADHVPLAVGDRVRVRLVGSAMVDGRARWVELPATFAEAGGSWRLAVQREAASTVLVQAQQPNRADRGKQGGMSQITYELQGRYDVRPQLASGRITFDIEGEQDADEVASADRWRRAARVADDLTAILFEESDFEPTTDDVERIYFDGRDGVRDVARRYALEAQRRGLLRDEPPWEVVYNLYENLLGRTTPLGELWDAERGFRGNVERYEEEGYAELVEGIVLSEEFADRYELGTLESMPLRDRTGDAGWNDWRRLRVEEWRQERAARSTRSGDGN